MAGSQTHYQPGDRIFGHYLVHEVISSGGMGEVYLCLYLEAQAPFALKTFKARYLTSLSLRRAFRQEIATWIALERHPNLVRCHGMQEIDNLPFMFLDWIVGDDARGVDLRSWLRFRAAGSTPGDPVCH